MIEPRMTLPERHQRKLDRAVGQLKGTLRENIHSIILYGSAIRGGFHESTSDLNLLIVLNNSTAQAHAAIRDVVSGVREIAPFIVELGGMPRATRVFALKFLSIRRDYQVLHGEDPLATMDVPKPLEILLAEQELRNLRMRLVNRYVTTPERSGHYLNFALGLHAKLQIVLSDALRTCDIEIPHDLNDRMSVFEKELGVDTSILREMENALDHVSSPRPLDRDKLHGALIPLLGKTLNWMEKKHPSLPL